MCIVKNRKSVKAIAVIGISLLFCGSVIAYADVADPWPGPRPHHAERNFESAVMPEVDFGIEENGTLTMYFHFSSPCQYRYVIRRADSDELVTYGKGIGSKDATKQDVFFYESPEDGVIAHYVLAIDATFQHQTRFGDKLSTNRLERHIYIRKVDGEDKVSTLPLGRV